jgi:hypothetical protein
MHRFLKLMNAYNHGWGLGPFVFSADVVGPVGIDVFGSIGDWLGVSLGVGPAVFPPDVVVMHRFLKLMNADNNPAT